MSNVCKICGRELLPGLVAVGIEECAECRGVSRNNYSSQPSDKIKRSASVNNFLRRANNGQC